MRYRYLNIAIAIAIAAVILQTTLFDRYLDPFGVTADFVLLVVVAASYHLAEEAAMVLGFTAGLLNDLLGNTLLGLWALVLTVIGYAAVRLRPRIEGNTLLLVGAVFLLTIAGELLFAVLGTLFDQRVFSDVNAFKKIILAAVYNLILAAAIVPLFGWFMRPERPTGVWA